MMIEEYLTEYRNLDKVFCGHNLMANTFDEAEKIADEISASLGIELKVVGRLIGVIDF